MTPCSQVWTVHKRVCGPGKTNPFIWPPLSRSESKEILEHLHDSNGQLAGFPKQTSTIANALQHFVQVPGRELRLRPLFSFVSSRVQRSRADLPLAARPQDCIKIVTEGGASDLVKIERRQRVLVIARAHEHARTLDLTKPVTRPAANPFGSLALWDWYTARDSTEASTMRWGDEPWRSWYRHAMLIFYFLMDQCRREPESVETRTRTPWLTRLHTRNDAFIRSTIAPTCPDLADTMLDTAAKVNQAMHMMGISTGHM